MNDLIAIDHDLSKALMGFMEANPLLSVIINKISNSNEVKGLISALIFWYLWFSAEDRKDEIRIKLLAIGLTTIISIAVGRTLANFLPFRPRPQANEEIAGPTVQTSFFLEEWSSMPSDHAVMFFALATGFFLVSKKAGLLAFLHAAVIVCLPRIVLGLHYLSDVIVGAGVGVLLSLICVPWLYKKWGGIINLGRYPERILYPFLVFATFNVATMFNGVRALGSLAKIMLQ